MSSVYTCRDINLNASIVAPLAPGVSGRVEDWADLNVQNFLSLNTTSYGRIKDGTKLFASVIDEISTGRSSPVYGI